MLDFVTNLWPGGRRAPANIATGATAGTVTRRSAGNLPAKVRKASGKRPAKKR